MESIPVLHVEGQTIALAFESALLELYQNGTRFKTQYDRPGDPESIDATMNITVHEPMTDPMIHQAFPGGIDSLREYVMEVKGIKDHWVKNINDPDDTRWEYTYHQRLAAYGSWQELQNGASVVVGDFCIDQIEKVIQKLVDQPHTRQAQMITWMPNLDYDCYDPPCLQSLWYRIIDDAEGTGWLNCNVRFRSNDAWGASFMNMFGFTMFNKDIIAAEVAKRSGRPVKLARMNWQADSYHIYGKDIAEAKARLFDRIDSTPLEGRVMNFNDEIIREIYDEAQQQVIQKIAEYDASH